MKRSTSSHTNRCGNNTSYRRIPLGPVEPFSAAKESNLDKVFYRYPKGIATSYGASFDHKEPQRNIPFFNMNTYQRPEYPHKLDLRTINRVNYRNTKSALKSRPGNINMAVPTGEVPAHFKTTYNDQYPCWGKPEFYHFKHKEPRVTSDELAFHGETTYGKSYTKKEAKNISPTKFGWEDLEYMYEALWLITFIGLLLRQSLTIQ